VPQLRRQEHDEAIKEVVELPLPGSNRRYFQLDVPAPAGAVGAAGRSWTGAARVVHQTTKAVWPAKARDFALVNGALVCAADGAVLHLMSSVEHPAAPEVVASVERCFCFWSFASAWGGVLGGLFWGRGSM
jgi:hypothetical protein